MNITPSQYAEGLVAAYQSGTVTPGNLVGNLLGILRRQGKSKQIHKIVAATEKLYRETQGEVVVTIETAHPVTKAVASQLVAKATEIFPGKKLIVEFKECSQLLMGYRIRSATRLFESSGEATIKALATHLQTK
jgi:F0F1-type ATP synthase delta subunit